jgi:hypothetical protein
MSAQQDLGIGGLAYTSTNDLSGTVADVTNGNTLGSTFKNGAGMAVIADTANEASIVLAGANALILGVLQNTPKVGEAAQIQSVRGSSAKVLLGGTVAKGDKLITDSSGRFVTATTGAQLICAQAQEAGAVGTLIQAVLLDSYIA